MKTLFQAIGWLGKLMLGLLLGGLLVGLLLGMLLGLAAA